MKKSLFIIVFCLAIGIALALTVGGYLWFTRAHPLAAKPTALTQSAAPASGTLSDQWQRSRSSAADGARAPGAYETPTYRQFLVSKDYYALFRSLDGRSDGEAKFFRASILERCKGYESTYVGPNRLDRAKSRAAQLTGAFRELRRDIFHEFGTQKSGLDTCHRFSEPITQVQIEEAYREAAEEGDTRGKLVQLHRSILTRTEGGPPVEMIDAPAGLTAMHMLIPDGLSEAEVALVKSALASKDPAQILFAGPLLTAMYKNYELKFGDGVGLHGVPDSFLWKSVACHYAGGCSIDSLLVIEDCLINGRCDVMSYDDKLQKYFLSPADWLRFQDYRATLIRAIDTQDWALLKESRAPRTNTYGTHFMPQIGPPKFQLRMNR